MKIVIIIYISFIIGIIHILFSYLGAKLPLHLFNENSFLFKQLNFEKDGIFYERYLGIRFWKNIIPDGGRIYKDTFNKKQLNRYDSEYIHRFIRETCRSEAIHWYLVIQFIPFIPLLPLWGNLSVFFVFVLINIPPIVVQRYNRIRLIRYYQRIDKSKMIIKPINEQNLIED